MPETTIDKVTLPISKEQIGSLSSVLDLLSKAQDAFEEINYTEDQLLNLAQRWLFTGFAEDAMTYLKVLIEEIIRLRSTVNGGVLVSDEAILKAFGKT